MLDYGYVSNRLYAGLWREGVPMDVCWIINWEKDGTYIVHWSIPDNPTPILCYVLNPM